MGRRFLIDERGMVTIDWVVLSAGILLFSVMAAYSVMKDSAGYLLDEFEQLNTEYDTLSDGITVMRDQSGLTR